jgi:hypothetical protein
MAEEVEIDDEGTTGGDTTAVGCGAREDVENQLCWRRCSSQSAPCLPEMPKREGAPYLIDTLAVLCAVILDLRGDDHGGGLLKGGKHTGSVSIFSRSARQGSSSDARCP